MSESATTPPPVSLGRRIRRFMSDQPLVPLIILLVALVVILQILRPGIVNERWIANTVKFAIPLAILAGCQTMTMLTGGIDLSVGTVATMSAFIMATQVVNHDPAVAILIALVPAVLIGLANGIGVGVFRVHPLIMTLGTSLDRHRLPAGLPAHRDRLGHQDPRRAGLARHRADLRRSQRAAAVRAGGGADHLHAAPHRLRPAALRRRRQREGDAALRRLYWQVITALYVISSLLAGITGLLYVGLIKAPSLSLAEPLVLPSVAAAVIGGTSIFGGRGGYTGTIVGALILTVLTTLLTILQMPEGARRILFGLIVLLVTAAYLRIIEDR